MRRTSAAPKLCVAPMRALLEQHTYLAIVLILFLEDMGIPLPIPADVVILYSGYRIRTHGAHPILTPLLMLASINGGATLLYLIVRRSGRPLVDRFGPYLHLSPARLLRAQDWLRRRGFWAIVLSRSIPGLRIATVVACGLLRVPARRFLLAQVLGTSIYMTFFLLLGYFVGPHAAERLRLPAVSLRVVLAAVVAIALPYVLRRLNRATAAEITDAIARGLSPGQRVGAALLAGFLGALELSLVLILALAPLEYQGLVQRGHGLLHGPLWSAALNLPVGQKGRALGLMIDTTLALLSCALATLVFFQALLPRLHVGAQALGRQAVLLWLFAAVLVMAPHLLLALPGLHLPDSGGPWLSHEPTGRAVWGLVVALLPAAYVAVETRRLAVDRFAQSAEARRG